MKIDNRQPGCFVFVFVILVAFAALLTIAAENPRSGKWPALERGVLQAHPTCAGCGKKATVVHHVLPFHLWPEKELDPTNFVAVCPDCHLHLCHLGDFKSFNPCARLDLARHLAEVKARPYSKADAKKFEQCFQLSP